MKYVETSTGNWEVVIGLEVHAQVITKSKLFSNSSTAFGANPNENVSIVDAALPGALPVINSFAIDQAIKTGLGLNGQINLTSFFDRKNYFYADLPSGYQISQFNKPIVSGGYIIVQTEDFGEKKIILERIHLEQDAGKSIHDLLPQKTCIDLNRAGVALMEIVTKPDMRSAEEAMQFVKKLRTILRYLKTCDGNMDEGSMRVDANISVHRPDTELGTRVEVKNVNSIRFLGQAIEYEVSRQIELIENKGSIIQETRLFDSGTSVTRPMRNKEDAQDYRYFPDPDLPPLVIAQERVDKIRAGLPELPNEKSARYQEDFELSIYDAESLASELELAQYYDNAMKFVDKKNAKIMANWILVEIMSYVNKDSLTISTCKISPQRIAELVKLIDEQVISGKIAKDVLEKMWNLDEDAKTIVEKYGLQQVTDTKAIEAEIAEVLKENADKVSEYRAGKDRLFGFFVGAVMKKTGGKINPQLLNDILKSKLDDK